MKKIYSLRDLFDFEEGTIFLTNFDNDDPTFEIWIEEGIVCFNDIYEEHTDNKANISQEWLDSKFILKS
jgi:hypothetical protein